MKTELWNGYPLRFVEHGGEWWAVAKDVCDALGIGQPTRSGENFPKDEALKVSGTHFQSGDSRGGASSFLCVNEPGLYRLIFQSRKPEAEAFKTWVFGIIKTIREALGYEQYRAMSFVESAKSHHLSMEVIKEALNPQDKAPFIKAHAVTNKCMGNIIGEAKAVGKDDLKARYPELLPLRDRVLAETAELMAFNEKYGMGLSVSKVIYGKFGRKSA